MTRHLLSSSSSSMKAKELMKSHRGRCRKDPEEYQGDTKEKVMNCVTELAISSEEEYLDSPEEKA